MPTVLPLAITAPAAIAASLPSSGWPSLARAVATPDAIATNAIRASHGRAALAPRAEAVSRDRSSTRR
jgi:hypothetical protein